MKLSERANDELARLKTVLFQRQVVVGLGLTVVLAGLLVVVGLYRPSSLANVVIDSAVSVLVALIAVYLSIDTFRRYFRRSEAGRIDSMERIVQRYADLSLLSLETVPGWRSNSFNRGPRVPFVTEYQPDNPTSVDRYDIEYIDEHDATLDDEVALVLEPYRDRFARDFTREDHFNGRRVALEAVSDNRFGVSPTSFFHSYMTVFSPDTELSGGRSLRDLTEELLLAEDGQLAPVSESPFDGAFGGGALLFTEDGRVVIPTRSRQVVNTGGVNGVSFGGTLDPTVVTNGDLREHFESELRQELNIEPTNLSQLRVLSIVRRLEALGKPDILAMGLADASVVPEQASNEHIRLIDPQVVPDRYLPIESVDDLLQGDVAEVTLRSVFDVLEDSYYEPGQSLLGTLWYLHSHAEYTDSESADSVARDE
ncbi:hypothetical protein Harman_10100 [Haloarcula mannanilytica]|uniref:Nudix hydrolase domain-containing protein n=1 Tax=Haloarcula mannanilytica TaxID=2509225 RepID=A0A4C2EF41_9EURY|nr:hypothetical protein [Haloarcula mannanilytica]GCF13075.1 hypothetical protein Harman_10100 [Haloarcula mannanilytica]